MVGYQQTRVGWTLLVSEGRIFAGSPRASSTNGRLPDSRITGSWQYGNGSSISRPCCCPGMLRSLCCRNRAGVGSTRILEPCSPIRYSLASHIRIPQADCPVWRWPAVLRCWGYFSCNPRAGKCNPRPCNPTMPSLPVSGNDGQYPRPIEVFFPPAPASRTVGLAAHGPWKERVLGNEWAMRGQCVCVFRGRGIPISSSLASSHVSSLTGPVRFALVSGTPEASLLSLERSGGTAIQRRF